MSPARSRPIIANSRLPRREAAEDALLPVDGGKDVGAGCTISIGLVSSNSQEDEFDVSAVRPNTSSNSEYWVIEASTSSQCQIDWGWLRLI